ncbi:hypothetical protein ACET8B_00175 [Aeromonas caviae]|uniref:hypothetical protein n=1 Tax=Aeromonas caviae TaxID=648 RepID=UPI0005F062AC|nr:hypothetical protein [Aeromonas caviae]ATP90198.1 hypothetical protein VI35_07730 [Aeromonas caviae]
MNTQAIASATMQNLVAVVEGGALMTTAIKVAEALCYKMGTTRYMLSIEPDSGSMSGRHGGDSITLWPVAERACVINPTDPRDMQRMLDLMKLPLASVTRRPKALMQSH